MPSLGPVRLWFRRELWRSSMTVFHAVGGAVHNGVASSSRVRCAISLTGCWVLGDENTVLSSELLIMHGEKVSVRRQRLFGRAI